MTLNKGFALIDSAGYFRYPYIITPRDKNKNPGYEYSPGKKRVPVSERLHTTNIEEIIVGVIFNKWKVRVKRDASEIPLGVPVKEAGARFEEDEFFEYWVSPKHQHLVKNSPKQPMQHPYSRSTSSEFVVGFEKETVDGRAAPLTSNGLSVSADEEIDPVALKAAEAEIDNDSRCKDIPSTEREALINARIGQGLYRKKMLAVWGSRCALTGLALESALIASHAKSWKNSENEERTDPYNGLLLAATVDKLFDQGFISFTDDGSMLIGSRVSEADLSAIGLSADARLSDRLHEKHKPYLRAHREQHGFEGDDAAAA